MQAAFTTAYGGPDKIEYSENFSLAQLKSNDHVLIQVANSALNPIDGLRNRGYLRLLQPDSHPHIFAYDVAGFVAEVGTAVTAFKKGDRVYARIGESEQGTTAGFVSVRDAHVAIAPKNKPLLETAGIPLVGLTVLQSFEAGNLKRGQRIFISKGAGGVGTFAIQLAKHIYGAYVITTASEKKIPLLKELGADEVIDYHKTNFWDVVKDVDFAYDVSDQPWAHAMITKKGGVVVALRGVPTAQSAKNILSTEPGLILSYVLAAGNFLTSRFAWWYGTRYDAVFCAASGKDLAQIAKYIEEGKIKPIVDSVYDLRNAKDAVEKLESGRATGKVIISVDDTLDKGFKLP